MAEELSYVLINPYTLSKSRTGGILARLLTRTALELVSAEMFAPSKELVEEYLKVVVHSQAPEDRHIQELVRDYVQQNYMPDAKTGRRKRAMMLLLKGENAVRRTYDAVGKIYRESIKGETIRETYGDYLLNADNSVRYFEPAVLIAPSVEETREHLCIWGKYAEKDSALNQDAAVANEPDHERTLVIIKPDNFRFPSGRPGNVMDLFAKSGLQIAAIKVHRMTPAEALEFYGPVRDILREKLCGPVGDRAKDLLQSGLQIQLDADTVKQLAQVVGPIAGQQQFDSIVHFMTGRWPAQTGKDQLNEPGTEKCICLVYEGKDAVARMREVLGPTDPAKAPPGSIRREFGQTIMVNAAHASDSTDNARRELGIIKIGENNFGSLVKNFCK